jgi:photosystem II stability/assembly factor-like uncharacterized protein
LPGSPGAGRFDDLTFINARTGWAVGAGPPSKIYKTTNGGLNWQLLYTFIGIYSRSVCFVDSMNGFLGSLNGFQHLFKTNNGGLNWDSVSFGSNRPNGICGMSFFGNTILGSGMYNGFPKIIISTNLGAGWQVIDMNNFADALVDCYMFSENEMFITGGIGTTFSNRKTVILYSSNGGINWITRFTSLHTGNWGWKISFADNNHGFVSMENASPLQLSYFAKTSNGGLNWEEKPFGTGVNFREQGIGFINQGTGWIGGYNYVYETTDGGDNWTLLNIGAEFSSVNRIRFYGDTLGYAGGTRIFKYTADNSIGISINHTNLPVKSLLGQNYPNPFNPVTVIKYEIFETSMSTIRIFNAAGAEVYVFMNGFRAPGLREFIWFGTDMNGTPLPSGVYFYKLETENFSETKKMILVR